MFLSFSFRLLLDLLLLSACSASDGKFMCDNGVCIPMSLRCDNRRHCNDGSDEKNCSPPNNRTSMNYELSFQNVPTKSIHVRVSPRFVTS